MLRRRLRIYLRNYRRKPIVRPWGLVAPVLVLLLCLPLLRPLHHPGNASDDERLLLATVRALVDHDSLELDSTRIVPTSSMVFVNAHLYSAEPPLYAVMLSGVARALGWFGLRIEEGQSLATYLLTLIGVTIPVVLASALLYRMGRLFELRRPWRALLALTAVFGSGLVSYAVVLNPHAPAACLLLGSAGALIHVGASQKPRRSAGWIMVAGACAALAATLDPIAAVIGYLMLFVIAATRFSMRFRIGGLILFCLGAAPAIMVHGTWNIPLTGDLAPGFMHPQLNARPDLLRPLIETAAASDDDAAPRSWWDRTSDVIDKALSGLFGVHGIITHFPITIIGVLGVFAVMHRHWPMPIKVMAAASLAGGIIIVLGVSLTRTSWTGAMFANRFLLVFLPLLLFWCGAWLRRPHNIIGWSLAGLLLAVSVTISIIGATDPYPARDFNRYTATEALARLMQSGNAQTSEARPATPSVLIRQ